MKSHSCIDINITNQRFTKLIALYVIGKEKNGVQRWFCQCDCGNTHVVSRSNLLYGGIKSCGCLKKQWCSQFGKTQGTQRRKLFGESSLNCLYANYKRRAKQKNMIFDLTIEQFKQITSTECYYCGIEPLQEYHANGISYGAYTYNGIDRLNNDYGYTIDNGVPCCKYCNGGKLDLSKDDYEKRIINMAKRITKRNKKKYFW